MSERALQEKEARREPVLYIVVPCYNEEAVLPQSAARLAARLRIMAAAGAVSGKSRVLFVNDGSRDGT